MRNRNKLRIPVDDMEVSDLIDTIMKRQKEESQKQQVNEYMNMDFQEYMVKTKDLRRIK